MGIVLVITYLQTGIQLISPHYNLVTEDGKQDVAKFHPFQTSDVLSLTKNYLNTCTYEVGWIILYHQDTHGQEEETGEEASNCSEVLQVCTPGDGRAQERNI